MVRGARLWVRHGAYQGAVVGVLHNHVHDTVLMERPKVSDDVGVRHGGQDADFRAEVALLDPINCAKGAVPRVTGP